MREHAQTVEEADPQDRRDQRPRETEHDQQRRDVAEQQVLDHVRGEQFLAVASERGERGADRHETGVEARLAPAGHRVVLEGERAHTPCVEHAQDQQRAELERVRPGQSRRCERGRHQRCEGDRMRSPACSVDCREHESPASLAAAARWAAWSSRRCCSLPGAPHTASSARPTCRSPCGCSAGPRRSCWWCPSWRSPRCGGALSCRSSTAAGCSRCHGACSGRRAYWRGAVRARALQRLRRGTGSRTFNFSVTFIYVIFWVGVPVASVLLGDVFRALNPWRACARDCCGGPAGDRAASAGAAAAALPAVAGDVACGGRTRRLCLARAGVCQSRSALGRSPRCRSPISLRCSPG